jgi:hypothetical protein
MSIGLIWLITTTQWSPHVNLITNHSEGIEDGKCLDQIGNYYLIRSNSALWSTKVCLRLATAIDTRGNPLKGEMK